LETFKDFDLPDTFPVFYRLTAGDGTERQRVFRLSGEFRVEQHVDELLIMLEIEGPFDVLHASLVKDILTERLRLAQEGGFRYEGVDCDLSKVTMIDSAAVGVLVVARTMLGQGRFRLLGLTPERKAMFTNIGIFELADSPERSLVFA